MERSKFWTKAKSVTLSLICTRVLICVAIVIAICLPFLLNGGFYGSHPDSGMLYAYMPAKTVTALYICAYACFIPAIIALVSLDRLLANIRKEQVFVRNNVKFLRIISWCCFAIAIIVLCGWPSISFVLVYVAAAAAFFGLLMRVVKNVIDAACTIKDENDFTI